MIRERLVVVVRGGRGSVAATLALWRRSQREARQQAVLMEKRVAFEAERRRSAGRA